jgi:hypothetical protein
MKTRMLGLVIATVLVSATILATATAATPVAAPGAQQEPGNEVGAPEPAAVSGISAVEATVSLLVGYQGRLVDPTTGQVKPDGGYSITFSLYTQASGGTAAWTETKTVAVSNGVFSTQLGDTTSLGTDLFNGQALWLGIQVESDAEATPRQPLTVVPYAAGLVPGAQVVGNSPTQLLTVANSSTAGGSRAIYGVMESTSPGPNAAAVRGQNKGTGSYGIGVYGSHSGAGFGVYGNAVSGTGVIGFSTSGTGVLAQSGSGTALYAQGDAVVNGDLTVNGALNGVPHAIAYADIKSDGSKSSGTSNVSSAWNASLSRYEITIAGESYSYSTYHTMVTLVNNCPWGYTAREDSVSGKLLVYIYDRAGAKAQCYFQFATYKP